MKKVLLLSVSLLLLSGCATTPVDRSLKSEHGSSARAARVFVIVPQETVTGTYAQSTAGQQYGIIGGVIDAYQTSKAYKEMIRLVTPIQQATRDVDFRGDFHRAIKNSGIFVKPAAVELLEKAPQSDDERRKLVASAHGNPVVFVEAAYRLDIAYRVLVVENRVTLWTGASDTPVYSVSSWYNSAPVSLQNALPPGPGAQLAPLWAVDGGKKYRAAYKEGIDETIKMMHIALVERPNNVPLPQDRIVPFVDYGSGFVVAVPRTKAKVVREVRDRSILLNEAGEFYSVSTGPTFASSLPELKTPAGQGRVFFYGPANDGQWIQPTFYLNQVRAGELEANGFFYSDFKPGKYTISLRYEGDGTLAGLGRTQMAKVKPVELVIEPNGRYFVKFDGFRGIMTSSEALKTVPSSTAEVEIGPRRLSSSAM